MTIGLPRAINVLARCYNAARESESTLVQWAVQMVTGGVAAGLVLAILIFSASEPMPPHGQTDDSPVNVASVIPLLSAAGVAESSAFFRVPTAETPTVEKDVQSRSARLVQDEATAVPRAIPIRPAEPPLEHDFEAPRIQWTALTPSIRSQLSHVIHPAPLGAEMEIILHAVSSDAVQNSNIPRYLMDVRRVDGSSCDAVIGPSGISILNQNTVEGPFDILLVGDFNSAPPSKDILEKLDEMLDYLALRAGSIQVLQHMHNQHSGSTSCLGKHFPIRQIATAIASSGN
ncbi:MAG: hypothetical protein JNJ83_00830 [Verrucomicrobiaceae bacterium]|nr:hypothetical protein [Verrucomicrobiaceae bacterium]